MRQADPSRHRSMRKARVAGAEDGRVREAVQHEEALAATDQAAAHRLVGAVEAEGDGDRGDETRGPLLRVVMARVKMRGVDERSVDRSRSVAPRMIVCPAQ